MELQELLDLFSEGKLNDLVNNIKALKGNFLTYTYPRLVREWDPRKHAVTEVNEKRPDKQIPTASGQGVRIVEATRLVLPLQKQIVKTAVQYLAGNPVTIERVKGIKEGSTEEQVVESIQHVWDENKLDYDTKRILTLMCAETEAAEIWYLEDAPEDYWTDTINATVQKALRPRMQIIGNKYGDELHPVFDSTGDLIAFCRGYETASGEDTIEHFDIFLDKQIIKLESLNNATFFTVEGYPKTNPLGKIPVVYWAQELEEWYDVQSLIERLEYLISKLTDINDYFGSPILLITAESKEEVEWTSKNEDGRAVLLKNGAEAKYLTWEHSPDSIKMELESLRSQIMDLTDTPDLTYDKVKGLGNYSGVALKLLFGKAHMKASDKEEIAGKCMQRRLNLMKAMMGLINPAVKTNLKFTIKPKFTYYMPTNVLEEVEILTAAIQAGFMSIETAVQQCSLIQDKKAELERLKAEKAANETPEAQANKLNVLMGGGSRQQEEAA